MPAATAIKGKGAKIQLAIASVYTDIAGVTKIGGPSMDRDMIDITDMESTSDRREFMGGLVNSGEVSFDIQYVPSAATHQALLDCYDDTGMSTQRDWKILFSSGATYPFKGVLKAFNPDQPIDGKVSASITIQVTGVITVP